MFLRNGTPLFRFLLLLICGILSARYFPILNARTTTILSCVLMAVFFLQFIFGKKIAKYQRRWTKGAISYAAVFFAGYLLTQLGNEEKNKEHFRNCPGEKYIGLIDEPLNDRGKIYRSFVKVLFVNDGQRWLPATGNCLVYFSGDSSSAELNYGDLIFWTGKPSEIQSPLNPAQFNYKSWLELRQVYDQKFLKPNEWRLLDSDHGNKLYAFSYSLRERFMKIFSENSISGQDYAVLSALILGYDDEIDSDVFSAYAASGTLHILSVSGLHVGIIFIAISRLLGFMNVNRRTRLIKSVVIILFLWFYALLTGLSPSVLRSATMLSFIIVGRMTRQHISMFNTLAASAFFLLVMDPFIIMQVGFQLSYLAVLGIIFLQPKIEGLLDPANWLVRNIWSITSVSIAAQLATFPLGLYYFHQFPVYFILSNLIIIPISTIVIYGGILLLMMSWWNAGGLMIGIALGSLVKTMNSIAIFIEKLPASSIGGISITVLETFLLYLTICAITFFLEEKRGQFLLTGFCSLLALTTSQLIESFMILHQEKLIVYSIRGKSVVNIIGAGKNIVIADSSLVSDKQQMSFNIYPYWWECGLDDRKFDRINEACESGEVYCFYKGFLQYRNLRIGFVRDDCPSFNGLEKPEVDFLIVSGKTVTKLKCLLGQFNFKHLIFDSSMASSKSLKLLNEAAQSGITAYSVQHQGAFVYDLSRN